MRNKSDTQNRQGSLQTTRGLLVLWIFLGVLSLTYKGPKMGSETVSDIVLEHERYLQGDWFARKADFRGVDLSFYNLSGLDLRGVDFSYAKLEYTIFKEANLDESNFTGALLKYSNLDSASVKHVNFNRADLDGVSLNNTDISESSLVGATGIPKFYKTTALNLKTLPESGVVAEVDFNYKTLMFLIPLPDRIEVRLTCRITSAHSLLNGEGVGCNYSEEERKEIITQLKILTGIIKE